MKYIRSRHPLQLTPGPSEPYPDALAAASLGVPKHYGDEWLEIYNEFIEYSMKLFSAEEGYIVPFYGSASSAMEAILNTFRDRFKSVLVVNDGFFVRRFKEIALTYGYEVHHIAPEKIGERVDIDELRLAINSYDVDIVFVVHSETSTGVMEDIKSIGEVVPDKALYVVDAVSSYGALNLDVESNGIDICIGYSSKAVGAIMGITPLFINDKIVELITGRSGFRGFSNDLKTWFVYRDKWPKHPYPTTLPTPSILSFIKAAEIILEEGLDKVAERHFKVSKYVYNRLSRLDHLDPLPCEGCRSPTVSVFSVDGYDSEEVEKYVLQNYNIMISTAKFAGYNAIRIGHMGYTADTRLVIPALEAIEEFFSKRV